MPWQPTLRPEFTDSHRTTFPRPQTRDMVGPLAPTPPHEIIISGITFTSQQLDQVLERLMQIDNIKAEVVALREVVSELHAKLTPGRNE